MFPQKVFDFLHGMVVGGFQCTDGSAGDVGNLLVSHLLEVFQVEDNPLLFRERCQCLLEQDLCPVAGEVRVAFQPLGDVGLRVVDGNSGPPFFFLQEGEAFVEGDAVEPRGHPGLGAEIVDVEPRLDEGVLQEVVGVVMRQHHPSDLPVQRFAVLPDDAGERFFLVFFVVEQLYDFFFVVSVHGVFFFVLKGVFPC